MLRKSLTLSIAALLFSVTLFTSVVVADQQMTESRRAINSMLGEKRR